MPCQRLLVCCELVLYSALPARTIDAGNTSSVAELLLPERRFVLRDGLWYTASGVGVAQLQRGVQVRSGNLDMTIQQEQLEQAIALAKAYGATRLILFGSAVTAPEQARDLDLACDGISGWKFYELGARLEEELRVPLDLVPLSPPTRFTRLIEQRGKVLL